MTTFNMKTKIPFVCCLLMLSYVSNAQIPGYEPLIPILTTEEIFAGKYVNLPGNSANNKTAQKPTTVKQRMVAATFGKGTGSAAPDLQDSSRYFYSGSRGSAPVRTIGTPGTISAYDTAYNFIKSDNFTATNPLYAQQFNSNDDLVNQKTYNPSGNIIEQNWKEYYPSRNLKRSMQLQSPNSTDWTYTDTELNEDGNITRDSSATMSSAPTNFSYSVITNQYGVNGRKEHSKSISEGVAPGVTSIFNYYYFFNTPNSLLPYKDSIVGNTITTGGTSDFITTSSYAYDGSGNMTEQITYTEPGHATSYKSIYTYDASGNTLSGINQGYNILTGQWENSSKIERGYTLSVNTTYASFNWNTTSNSWTEMARSGVILNADTLVDSMKNYFLGTPHSIYTYEYNSFKNITRYAEYYLQASNGSVGSTNEYRYYYDDYITGIDKLNKKNLSLILYPNPVQDMLNFSFENRKTITSLSVRIYDLTGNVRYTATLNSKQSFIPVMQLVPGTYYLEITNKQDGYSGRKSFVKL